MGRDMAVASLVRPRTKLSRHRSPVDNRCRLNYEIDPSTIGLNWYNCYIFSSRWAEIQVLCRCAAWQGRRLTIARVDAAMVDEEDP
jgi:hypothetical protein